MDMGRQQSGIAVPRYPSSQKQAASLAPPSARAPMAADWKGSSPEAQHVNKGKELPILLVYFIQPGVDRAVDSKQVVQNRVYFSQDTLSVSHQSPFCIA